MISTLLALPLALAATPIAAQDGNALPAEVPAPPTFALVRFELPPSGTTRAAVQSLGLDVLRQDARTGEVEAVVGPRELAQLGALDVALEVVHADLAA